MSTKNNSTNTKRDEEEQQLKEELEQLVEQIKNGDEQTKTNAINKLHSNIIKNINSTNSQLPKITKLLKPKFEELKYSLKTVQTENVRKMFADTISLLVMAGGEKGESLKYKMIGNRTDLENWGEEYSKNLTQEMIGRFSEGDYLQVKEELQDLSKEIVLFHFSHNAEQDAFDFCLETNQFELIEEYIEKANFEKLYLYAVSSAAYFLKDEADATYKLCLRISIKLNKVSHAMRIMLKMNEFSSLVTLIENNKNDLIMIKQIGYMLSRVRDDNLFENINALIGIEDEIKEIIISCMSNSNLAELMDKSFELLQLKDYKTVDQVCTKVNVKKSIINTTKEEPIDMKNVGECVANCLANAGYGYDSLIHTSEGSYVENGKSTLQFTSSSLMGLIHLNRIESIEQLISFSQNDSMYIRAGTCASLGVLLNPLKTDLDYIQTFLIDAVNNEEISQIEKISAILGIGIGYAGRKNYQQYDLNGTEEMSYKDYLMNIIDNCDSSKIEVISYACLALGLIYQGTADNDIVEKIIAMIFTYENDPDYVKNNLKYVKYCIIGLSLLFLFRSEEIETVLDSLKALPEPLNQFGILILTVCAFAGSSNVIVVQDLIETCGGHEDPDIISACSVGVLGIPLILMTDEFSNNLSIRLINEILRYGEPSIKRYVPFAIALTSIGKADVNLLDQLSRLAHSNDSVCAQNAILSIGLMAAGTLSTKAISLLNELTGFYANDANCLYSIRVAQGLVHLGKGALTLNPLYSDRFVMDPVALSGLLTFIMIAGDGVENYLNFNALNINLLSLAMRSNIFIPVDENDNLIKTNCKIGNAVDIAGQAGAPKRISGFQVHDTPALVGVGQRAELSNDDYSPLSSVLEGVVLLKKN